MLKKTKNIIFKKNQINKLIFFSLNKKDYLIIYNFGEK